MLANKKLLFSGCSFTAGNGWVDTDTEESKRTDCKNSPHLWVNICHTRIDKFSRLDLINVAHGGASNTEIFQNTVREIVKHGNQIDTVFCQWTGMPRYNWNVGFELWNTSEGLLPGRTHDITVRQGDTWSRKYLNDLSDRLRVLHHLHWEILKVVDYSNIIYKLTKQLGILNVFFVNGLCPWDNNYFIELDNVKPEMYTAFTKKEILDIDTRNDADILELYKLAHKQYQEAGGMTQLPWINLYNSLLTTQVDTNFDSNHPGEKSNILYYEMINARLHEIRFI